MKRKLLFKIVFFMAMYCFTTQQNYYAQCNFATAYQGGAIAANGSIVTLSTCNYAGEYSTVTGATAGTTLRFTSSISTDYITVRSSSPGGAVIAYGPTPLTFSNTFTGTVYSHYSSNSSCGTASACRTTTVQCLSCGGSVCNFTSSFGSATIATDPSVTTIATCSYAGEYSTISGAVAGKTLKFTSSVGTDYITVRSGTSGGAIIASGPTPLTFLNTFTGTIYPHWSTNAACGTQNACRTTTVQCTSCAAPPALGDTYGNPFIVNTTSYTTSGTTVGFTNTIGNASPDVWYRVNLNPCASTLNVSTCTGTSYDSFIRVYASNGTTELASNDDFCGLQSTISNLNVIGQSVVYVLVEGFGSNSGAYGLTINQTLQSPPGDTYATPINVTSTNYTTTGNTSLCYTNTIANASPDVWYKVNLNSCATALNVSTCTGSSYDTFLRVYAANGITELASNDDSCGLQSTISNLNVTGQTIVYVLVEGYLSASGAYGLNIDQVLAPLITYYADSDGDGFGNPSISQVSCIIIPSGYVTNNSDCNDNQIQYADLDGDGFGSTIQVACGVANNADCNDNQIQYADLDGDGFGSTTQVACGVTNNSDCNDNQIQYADLDGDGFGSTTQVACGVTNNLDCNDNQIQYADLDGDGFGSTTQVACGVINNSDCNDNQIQYADLDGDGFGSTTQVACGVTNNSDCNDNQIQYADLDGDGFGSTTQVACGVTNNSDCNDNQIQYADLDGDGFGSTTQVACGVTNNSDCNDNQIQYADLDGDGFGTITQVACGSSNNTDCNDNNAAVHPGAVDICYDGLDNDCNGNIDNVGMPGGCTPIVSTLQATLCGTTLNTIDQYIYANLVSGAQGYRFRITDLSAVNPTPVQTIDKALRVFALTQLTYYKFDTTYQIEVSIKKFNVWQPFYGAPCNVTTPATTTQVRATQCGSTLTAMTDVIYADLVPFATGYRFRVTNVIGGTSQVLDRALREFRMNLLVNPEYNALYTVEVAVRNTDGTYLSYGTACNITTPVFPTTSLQNSQCDYTAVTANETFYAISYPGATTYRFKFMNTALSYVYTFDKSLRTFNLSEVPGLQPATTYSVQVSIELNGVFGPYGKVCSLTTPGSVARTDVKKLPFTAVAYPNPYAESFNLNVTTSSDENISVTVYDMIGKQIEVRQVSANAINTIQIGDRYPSGVYNVIVTQGENSQNVRVIKR